MIAHIAKEVKATAEQKSELNQICQDKRSKIENMLTPEQREVFNASLAEGKNLLYAIQQLELSDQQQERLERIRESTRTRIKLEFGWNLHRNIHKSRQKGKDFSPLIINFYLSIFFNIPVKKTDIDHRYLFLFST